MVLYLKKLFNYETLHVKQHPAWNETPESNLDHGLDLTNSRSIL